MDTDHIYATYRHVYALTHKTNATDFRLERWRADQFFDSTPFVPQIDRTISSPSGDVIEQIARMQDDDAIAYVTAADNGHSDVYWTSLDDSAGTVSPLHLDIEIDDLIVHGDRVFALGWHSDPSDPYNGLFLSNVVFVAMERRGDSLVEVARGGWPIPMTFRNSHIQPIQLLRFDGHVVYAQLPSATLADPVPAVVALRADDLSQHATYVLQSATPLWSATESDVGLVFSGPAGVTIVRPWCP